MARLIVLKGATPNLGPYELRDDSPPMLIGRGPGSNIQFSGPAVSRTHCEVRRHPSGGFVLRVLGGRDSTYVNKKPVTDEHVLADGDVITLADCEIRFETAARPPEGAPLPSTPIVRPLAEPALPLLVTRDPKGKTSRYPLLPEVLKIGRHSGSRALIDDINVSLNHAVIEPIADGHQIRDVGSSNGTWFKGKKLEGPHRLGLDDVFSLGSASKLLYTARPESEWAALMGPLAALASSGGLPQAKPAAKTGSGILELSRDLTALARAGKLERVIGRKTEIRRLAQILGQKRKPNAILVGEAGVGKTGLVEGLAQRIAAGDCPPSFKDRRVIEISIASLVSGTTYRGELEKKVEELLRDAEADPNVILFIDEIHMAVGAGKTSGGATDIANLLKPVLARGTLRVIGATTTAEYQKHIGSDPAFQRRFEVVWVEEPTRDEAVEILTQLRADYETHHKVKITDDAIAAAVDFSLRYVKERKLPDKALDLIDQACTRTTIGTFRYVQEPADDVVDRAMIARVVAENCRIPIERLLESQEKKIESAGDFLGRRVIGQPEAIKAVSRALLTAQAGLKDPRRPIAALLFAGPSGTGKTELAKALAEYLFHDEAHLVHLDMSEYAERHTVSRLYGSPPGYVGSDDEGQLTGAIRRTPLSVVLFDEIEKAHPDVLNVLLQILDEGRLTDGKGRRADFREAVVILSTNLGSSVETEARGHLGFMPAGSSDEDAASDDAVEERQARVFAAIDGFLRPEIVNRLTGRIVFEPLSVDSLEKIVEARVQAVERRLGGKRVTLVLAVDARRDLATRAHNPRFGGREVERFVQREVAEPLAAALVEGRIVPGARVDIVLRGGKIVVEAH